ncbi:hypothetical protein AYL99_02673 [Fonsecaea erecta]|uniref:Restriction of telomere capping protein 4 n=1 Tax=Fonsecaea erecta TaxID=1367422 RepID=A0A178ZVJ3_9EURO|nr:hypothetical protein AYL99_02673 [Fonsecaea erecta]OAP63446.1 hypothetical protein AYL99_02673 [Fonsecaea erecta]
MRTRSGDADGMIRSNASFSRTYLTREHYSGPTLLRCIRAEEVDKQILNPVMQTDMREDENLIYAPPDSSSSDEDEDDYLAHETSLNSPEQPRVKAPKSGKRAAHIAASTSSKRRKIEIEQAPDSPKTVDDSPRIDPVPGWISSGPQKRKPSKNYANRKLLQRLEIVASTTTAHAEGNGIVSPQEETSQTQTTFIEAAEVPTPGTVNGSTKPGQRTTLPSPPSERSDPERAGNQISDLPNFSLSGGIDKPTSVDAFIPRRKGRSRSASASSVSSLSSVDEVFLVLHENEFSAEHGSRSAGVRCPVCQQTIYDSVSVFIPENLRTMPFKQQQKFCTDHRLKEARKQWEERGYPKLDWAELETFRIPKKTPQLKRVLSRTRPSYYRDQFDAMIKEARGNRKAIRSYLNEGLSDIAKPGYYGPKGTRIMVHAITELLSKNLIQVSQTDPSMQATGVGAYVSAVLVPELTMLLVMEDMKLRTGKDGRRVLDESSDIGILLNPDDDRVKRVRRRR